MNDKMNMTVTRIFDTPPEQVWKAWSEEALVKQWWGPKGFTCPVANMQFREGGTSLVCMRPPVEYGGPDLYNTWTYTTIIPGRMIEFTQGWADEQGNPADPASMGLPPGLPKEVDHVVTFKAVHPGKTEITITEYGYERAEIVEISRAGMLQCLDKMVVALQ